jgi:hypothetical protein
MEAWMPNKACPIGRLRKHVRATYDGITREELPEHLRELVEKLRQAESVKAPLKKRKPSPRDDQ